MAFWIFRRKNINTVFWRTMGLCCTLFGTEAVADYGEEKDGTLYPGRIIGSQWKTEGEGQVDKYTELTTIWFLTECY